MYLNIPVLIPDRELEDEQMKKRSGRTKEEVKNLKNEEHRLLQKVAVPSNKSFILYSIAPDSFSMKFALGGFVVP